MKLEERIGKLLSDLGYSMATAESCTGGGVAALVTSVAGSSAYFKGGVVAYSNEIKENLLGVSHETLQKYGAVSEQTVREMAEGACRVIASDCAVATSGIAGPGGGTLQKPVGTIWIAVTCKGETSALVLSGDEGRSRNVEKTIRKALSLLEKRLEMLKKGDI